MSETRRDKRAELSLKIKFKSATQDEFVEQYSGDVSRGGIFIKSKTPMEMGTLLKFEFQLKDGSPFIHGVGRVVWRREGADVAVGKPAGMGIKFIKMDAESKALVERIVESRGDGPGSYDAGAPSDEPEEPSAPEEMFFPSTAPAAQPKPEDRTSVRHASELLAQMFNEGGSDAETRKAAESEAEAARKRTAEIEAARAAEARAAAEAREAADALPDDDEQTRVMRSPELDAAFGRPSSRPSAPAPSEARSQSAASGRPEAAKPAPVKSASTPAPAPSKEAAQPAPKKSDAPKPKLAMPPEAAKPEPAKKSNAMPIILGVVVLLALAAGAYVMTRPKAPPPEPAPVAAPAPAPAPVPEPVPEPIPEPVPEVVPEPVPVAPVVPTPTPVPAPVPTPSGTRPVPSPTTMQAVAPTPAPTPEPAPTPDPAPAPAPEPTPEPAPAPAPAPAPEPAPAPAPAP